MENLVLRTTDEINEIATALSLAQSQIESAKKSSDNPFFKSKYADLAEVWNVAREPLTKNGLSVCQIPATENGEAVVYTILLHKSGQFISGKLAMKPTKTDPQGIGSAITYARRYALAAMLGIAQEDDDGNAASHAVKHVEKPKPEPKKDNIDSRIAEIAKKYFPSIDEYKAWRVDNNLCESLKDATLEQKQALYESLEMVEKVRDA